MASLLAIQGEILAIRRHLEMREEIDPATLESWLIAADEALETKVDSYCSLIREFIAMAAARREESSRLAGLAKIDDNKAARLKAVLREVLIRLGISSMSTPRHAVRVQKAGGKQSVTLTAEAPSEYLQTTTTVAPDLERIRAELESGAVLDFAALAPRSMVLVIR